MTDANYLASKRFLATATATARRSEAVERTVYLDDEDPDERSSERMQSSSRSRGRPETVPYPKFRPKADPVPLVDYLQRLLPPLEFPATVATQMLTHISAAEAWAGHNVRLSFIGAFHPFLSVMIVLTSLLSLRPTCSKYLPPPLSPSRIP